MPEESHPGFEIMLIIEGTQESVIHGYTYTVEEGPFFSFLPGSNIQINVYPRKA